MFAAQEVAGILKTAKIDFLMLFSGIIKYRRLSNVYFVTSGKLSKKAWCRGYGKQTIHREIP